MDQKIKDTEGLRQQAVQAIKLLEQESVPCADRREKEYDILLVSKGMALKRKSKKRQIELGVLNVVKESPKNLL